MEAAVAARKMWASRQGGPAGAPIPGRTIARIATGLLLALGLAVVTCAAIGLTQTQRSDSRQEIAHRAALKSTLEELRTVFGDVDHFDSAQLDLIARRAGLDDLRFDEELTADRGREAQSLQNMQGRIVGWFSWAPDRGLAHAMNWLWGVVLVFGVVLILCAASALWATRRLAGSFARSIATVHKLTTQDAGTGLPNRAAMLERLEQALDSRHTEPIAFLVIDIDNFRDVNDALGRAGGNAMLLSIAERLRANLPAGAMFGRFEDDEFALILGGNDPHAAAAVADTLIAALSAPIVMDQMWQISVSIGIAQAPEDGVTADDLYRRAALALRAAKRSGRGSVKRFVPQIHEEHSERRFFLRELEAAIHNEAFDVHYQPVVAADGGGIVGVEALARWNHPTRGAIAPSVFIPLAEESGLMNRLGEIVLRRALADGARWRNLFMSVNLSPVQMRDPGLVGLIAAVLSQSGMTASRLVLEVTEGILIDNPEETQIKLEALRALGVCTALDDFGTGYSSLNYLQRFPFDRLKIDRSFVASLGTTGNTGAIIQAIVTLGHALGMKVLAEGVETTEQRVLLRLGGCDEMQGFLFAKACPAEAIDKVLSRPAPARGSARQTGEVAS